MSAHPDRCVVELASRTITVHSHPDVITCPLTGQRAPGLSTLMLTLTFLSTRPTDRDSKNVPKRTAILGALGNTTGEALLHIRQGKSGTIRCTYDLLAKRLWPGRAYKCVTESVSESVMLTWRPGGTSTIHGHDTRPTPVSTATQLDR